MSKNGGLLAVGYWLLAFGYWLLAFGFWLFGWSRVIDLGCHSALIRDRFQFDQRPV